MAETIVAPAVEVGKESPKNVIGVDFSKLTDEQLDIAERVVKEAEAQGLDPNLALSIAHIENRFTHGRTSPVGASGVMQLMPATAKELGVDPADIDQNIKGGITYYKRMLDKYKDPYVAGIAYNAGPGIADKFLETNDPKVIPTETLDYVDNLDRLYKPQQADIDTGTTPEVVEPPKEKPGFEPNYVNEAIGAGTGAIIGAGAGVRERAKIKEAERGERATERQLQSTEKRIAAGETKVSAKEGEFKGRVKIQSTMAENAAKEAARLRADVMVAEERLAKATDNARRYGVLEETVKTTPGGVTQEGGLGSGAMRHSNVMGEVHEANVVRKGTESAGPGWSQKSRLIVPDKYTGASVYNEDQLAAQKELAAAEAEHAKISKAADKAESIAQKESERLRNLTEKGPAGKTAAQASLDAAKEDYARLLTKKMPGIGTNFMRGFAKLPLSSALPGAAAGYDLVQAGERFKQGDYPGAALSGLGAIGGFLSMVPPVTPPTAAARAAGTVMSIGAPIVQQFRDTGNAPPPGVKFSTGGKVVIEEALKKLKPTVRGRERVAFPEIYRDPRIIVSESAERVPAESPLLRQLFGVTREDLDALTRDYGHELAAPYYQATRPPEYLRGLTSKANTQRIQDILFEAERNPKFAGSYGWYESSPLKNLFIAQNPRGEKAFERFTQLGAGLSPSTAVPKEIERSSVAFLMDQKGRLSDFLNPKNMPKGYGHAYHTTAHNAAIKNILERGDFRPKDLKMAPKTRVYYESRLGSNLDVPTADAHFVRGIGLADLRPTTKAGDFGSSISSTELDPVAKWYRSDVSEPISMRASPAQALQWNAMGTSTGVETELGVPYLELLARRIGDVADREGKSVVDVRDAFIRGERHLAQGGRVQNYKGGGDVVDLSNSSRTLSGEERLMLEAPDFVRNTDYSGPTRALKKLAGTAGEGLGYLKEGLNQIRPRDEAYLIPNLEFNLGDLVPGAEALKRWSKPGEGPVSGGKYSVNPFTGEGSVSAIEPDLEGLADVGFLYGTGISKPVTAGVRKLAEKYGPAITSKLARPYAMAEATSPELLQDTYRMRGTGELANDPLGLSLSDERARVALERAGLSKYDVRPGQGAWGGGGDSEFNRGYSIKLPRGDMTKSEKALAQYGSDTDQMMMSAIKFKPQKSWTNSTAIEIKNVSEKDIVNLNKSLGDEFVLQHRPQTNSVVIFNYTDKPKYMGDLEEAVNKIVPKGKVTPGTYESNVLFESEYASKGAKPKGRKTIETEQKIINRQR